jgi:mono/diheme cytochrome c family protein
VARLAAATLIGGAALAASGCGTGGLVGQGDTTNGKKLFQEKCGFCHTLADAGTSGTAGPNLDNAFAAVRAKSPDQRFQDDTIREVVGDQIRIPGQYQNVEKGSTSMPANLVTGSDLADVATYVATVAGTQGFAEASGGAGATTTSGGGGGGGSTAHGQQLYASLGCQGCHTVNGQKATGPTFKGLAGSKVTLTDGKTVTADDAYLLESIEDPDAQIVKGHAKGVMSSVIKKGQVSKSDADALVAYIKSLK